MNQAKELEISEEAFARFSYGLYLLSVESEGVENACILNTVIQVTDEPKRILFVLGNGTYTASLLHVGAECCVSILAEDTPFSFFRLFGYSSGRDVQKLTAENSIPAANGARYPTDHAVALIAATVHASIPCGTHTVYLADVCEARILSGKRSLTYEHYQNRIKGRT